MTKSVLVGLILVFGSGCGAEERALTGSGDEPNTDFANAGGGFVASGDEDPRDADASASDAGAGSCGAAAAGVQVRAVDLNGYPPYAVDGCELVYVAAPESDAAGALVVRDLMTGDERVLAPAAHAPRRPSISDIVITWEATIAGADVVRIDVQGRSSTLSGAFRHAGEPRAAPDAVVFTGWLSDDPDGDTDVFLFELGDAEAKVIAGGPAQQRFADVSTTHVAVTDFSEDAGGAYDSEGKAPADVVVVERATGKVVRRELEGKQAYPILGAGEHVIYLEWLGVRPMPKLEGYDVRSVRLAALEAPGRLLAIVDTDPPSIRPTAKAGRVEWVSRDDDRATLWRARADAVGVPVPVEGLDVQELHAPAASRDFTVLASDSARDAAALASVPRER